MADSENKTPKKGRKRSRGKRSKSSKTRQKKPRKQKMLFPAEQTHLMLIKVNKNKALEPEAAVFFTATDEYVAHELIELAGNHATTRGSDTITAEDVVSIVQADDELYHLFQEFVPKVD